MCTILHANEHFGHYAKFINDAAAMGVREFRLAASSKGHLSKQLPEGVT